MLGPEGASLAIATLLEDYLPAKVDELAARLEVTRLPLAARRALVPKLVAPFDVLDLPVDCYPAVLVVAQTLTRLERVDVEQDSTDAGQARYRARYPLRVIEWVRAVDTDLRPGRRGAATDQARKRLILATREVLLDHQALTVTIGDTPDLEPDDDGYRPGVTLDVAIDETTLREDYSPLLVDGDGPVAGAWVDLEVTVDELVPAATPAPAVTSVTATVVGHPALEP